jgi:membrane protease YdiL (CAAX protease family)
MFAHIYNQLRKNRFVTSALVVLSFFIGWSIIISIVFSIWENPSFIARNPALLRLYWEIIPLIAIVGVTAFFVTKVSKKQVQVILAKHAKRDVLSGLVFGTFWALLASGLLAMTNTLKLTPNNTPSYLLVWLFALFCNAAMQELLVRGYIFSLIRHKFNVTAAIIVSTVLFVAMHGPDLGAYGLGMLNVITASLVFGLLLLVFEGLLVPILVHFVWNILLGVLLGSIVLADDYPSMYHAVFHGSAVITGGAMKIEGSLFTLILNLLVLFGLVYYYRKGRAKLRPVTGALTCEK